MNIYDIPELRQYLNSQGLKSLYSNPTYIEKQNVNPFFQPYESPTYLAKQNVPYTGIMTQAPLKSLGFDTSYGVANEEDVEQVEYLPGQEPTGIAKLFDFLSNFIPGVGLIKRLNESGGIRGLVPGGIRNLNQRIQQSDFGRSSTLAEYFQKRRERKQAERAQKAMPSVYESAKAQGFTNERGGFSTDKADDAGTSLGSGQFSPSTSRGRAGY